MSRHSHIISRVPVSKETLPKIRVSKLMRQGHGKCVRCGIEATHVVRYTLKSENHRVIYANIFAGKVMMTADHILPRALGGADKLDNLQLMCYKCNTKKGMLPTEAEIDLIIQNRKNHIRPGFHAVHMRYVIQEHPELARLYDLTGQEEGPVKPFKPLQKSGNAESHMKRVTRLSGGLVDNKHPHHPAWGWVRIFDRFPELRNHVTFNCSR